MNAGRTSASVLLGTLSGFLSSLIGALPSELKAAIGPLVTALAWLAIDHINLRRARARVELESVNGNSIETGVDDLGGDSRGNSDPMRVTPRRDQH